MKVITNSSDVRFEVSTAVTKKNTVFLGVTLYDSCKTRHFGETSCLHHQGDKNWRASIRLHKLDFVMDQYASRKE
jgi:hypothetical protein